MKKELKEEFEMRKELIKLEEESKMKLIKFENDCFMAVENLKFDHQIQLQKLRNSDIKKTIQDRRSQ